MFARAALLAADVYPDPLIVAGGYLDYLSAYYSVKQILENDALHRETVVLLE